MNKTAYMVMRYENGSSLAKMLQGGTTLSEAWLKNVILPIIDGLSIVHAAGFIHRDIKPDNIYIRKNRTPVLLDFGSARATNGAATRTLTSLVTPGYAPFEQYYAKSSKQGPWTDIYAMGATLYRASVGTCPPDALARSEAILGETADPYLPAMQAAGDRYSMAIRAAIDHALAFRETARPPDLASWVKEIRGETVVMPARRDPVPRAPVKPVKVMERLPRRLATRRAAPNRGRRRIAAGAVLLAAAAWVPTASMRDHNPSQIATAEMAAGKQDFPHAGALPPADTRPRREGLAPMAGLPPAEDLPPGRGLAATDNVDAILRDAWDDIGDGRFIGAGTNNALYRFKRALALEPRNSRALTGIATLNAYFMTKAEQAAIEGRRREAIRYARSALASASTPSGRATSRQLLAELRRSTR